MLCTLSALTFDPAGFVQLNVKHGQTLGETRRRVNRIATLDGGAVVNDFGFSEADRTIRLAWTPTDRATEAGVDRMVQTYDRVHVSTRAGLFLAAPESYTPGADESTLTLLVLSKLSA